MKAAVGSIVSLYYDTRKEVEEGDYIVTKSKRTYMVVKSRQQEKGKHAGRWHLSCLIVEHDLIPKNATIHTLWWYKR